MRKFGALTPIIAVARSMSDAAVALLGAVAGAVAGGAMGGVVGLVIAPTKAEREERGRQRIEGRRRIASAVVQFQYDVAEARHSLYSLGGSVDGDAFEGAAVTFTADIVKSADVLPWTERRLVRWRVGKLMGPGLMRTVELRPAGRYAAGPDSARLQAIADTRSWSAASTFDPALLLRAPTDPTWDKVLRALRRLQTDYPAASASVT